MPGATLYSTLTNADQSLDGCDHSYSPYGPSDTHPLSYLHSSHPKFTMVKMNMVSVATVQLTMSWLTKLWLFDIVAGLSITGHSQAKVLAQPQFRVGSNFKFLKFPSGSGQQDPNNCYRTAAEWRRQSNR